MDATRNPLLRLLLVAVALATVVVLAATTVLTAVSSARADDEPALGSARYQAPVGVGWGTPHPRHFSNGGDPAGDVSHVRWRHWGAPTARGRGLTWAFRPQGGYYARPVRIQLRAEALGTCADGTFAYTRLEARVAPRPGAAPSGRWFSWAGPGGSICGRGAL
jgi:hypothetical protein